MLPNTQVVVMGDAAPSELLHMQILEVAIQDRRHAELHIHLTSPTPGLDALTQAFCAERLIRYSRTPLPAIPRIDRAIVFLRSLDSDLRLTAQNLTRHGTAVYFVILEGDDHGQP